MSGTSGHSLAFRVMRLCRPAFQVDLPMRVDPVDLITGEDFLQHQPSAVQLSSLLSSPAFNAREEGYWRRFELEDPMDGMGISGLLVLPQSFGSIFLGETFCSYISVANHTRLDVRDVVIKAEIQTERQRIMLTDNSKTPMDFIKGGGRHDFIIEHDIKELGAHTLMCMAVYTDPEGERKCLPQYFKFTASNPLSVRTKVRTVQGSTLLEACIENHTKAHLFMDKVRFEPAPPWTVTVIQQEYENAQQDTAEKALSRSTQLIRANGGVHNYLYQLRHPQDPANMRIENSNILGKLDITWHTTLGEPGRLQTQQILGNPLPLKEVDISVTEIPLRVIVARPFLLQLSVSNNTDRRLGPLEVFMSQDEVERQGAIVINGLWTTVVPSLAPYTSTDLSLSLVATTVGVQKIPGIGVMDARDGKLYDTLAVTEVFVESH
ncbi:hypothetical protein KP509_22G026700 [Ceratopteris richardii]|uniref:Trafficking protein particle complex subunit 13 n=1 Tax=Ceratopteris richardii TaxID=49495 RepID=A0A8T2S3J1_CERRI|nr:hypothetical protein KP509_22G026700 [Ceratopteris richardii]